MRVGIFGGSFNPVHQQHLTIARSARSSLDLDQVWFLPVYQPVHKSSDELLDYQFRRDLLELALADDDALLICDAEKELGGASYTVRTVKHLQSRFVEHQFFLIIGGDSLADLATWRCIDELVNMVEFIVVERPGFRRESPVGGAKLHWAGAEVSPLSSSQIRERLQAGDFKDFMSLPALVLFKILRSDFYGGAGEVYRPVLKKLNEYLLEMPDGLRMHVEGVALEAFLLALGADLSPMKAIIAGLAHDLFRIAPAAKILKWAQQAGYQLSPLEQEKPMLAHGAAAAGLLGFEFPELDQDLLEALRFHTLPELDLSDFGKILVIADTLEPSRKIPEREELRVLPLPLQDKYNRVLALKREAAKRKP